MSNASNLLSLVAIAGTGGFLLAEFGATPQSAAPVAAQEEVAAPAPETTPETTTPESVSVTAPVVAEVNEAESKGGFHSKGNDFKETLDPKDGKEMLPPIAAGPEEGSVPGGFLPAGGVFGAVALPSNDNVVSN